ncbi:VOC family protein [Zunongwangia sp. H14]|uniref:VOC family protein n=1 Tax=Zunongwangia sp. H14 TaxID=3240792 RepID=UPI0035645F91
MENSYRIPSKTHIGHVHLRVANLDKSLEFYHGLLGFEITEKVGEEAAFLSAGGYHHHIGLNTWNSKGAPKASRHGVGLYHTAIVFPSRKDLAKILNRLLEKDYPLLGAADHGVSEAIYLDDPDGNGVELYWDRPREEWPQKLDGSVKMYTRPLHLRDLLKELS